jgi:hypothetical protein
MGVGLHGVGETSLLWQEERDTRRARSRRSREIVCIEED